MQILNINIIILSFFLFIFITKYLTIKLLIIYYSASTEAKKLRLLSVVLTEINHPKTVRTVIAIYV